jgi:hypothetical protein
MDASARAFKSRLRLGTAMIAVIGCLWGLSSIAQTSFPTIRWDTMQIGLAPPDFEFRRTGRGGPGRWNVVDDETAEAGRAIEQVSTDATDYRFPLAIYTRGEAKNLEVTVRFKALTGKVDQAGGIALRLVSPEDYYVVRANALENNVRFYRVVKVERRRCAGIG